MLRSERLLSIMSWRSADTIVVVVVISISDMRSASVPYCAMLLLVRVLRFIAFDGLKERRSRRDKEEARLCNKTVLDDSTGGQGDVGWLSGWPATCCGLALSYGAGGRELTPSPAKREGTLPLDPTTASSAERLGCLSYRIFMEGQANFRGVCICTETLACHGANHHGKPCLGAASIILDEVLDKCLTLAPELPLAF